MNTTSGSFIKSNMGAQAAWKGFSAQTLYIAFRLMNAPDEYLFCPEDIEDLLVKKENDVIEAVQVKNIAADLTISSLASTKSSKGGEGFFKRVCHLHTLYPEFSMVRVVYFQDLGEELLKFVQGEKGVKENLTKKLVDTHELEEDEVAWLLSSLVFEKVDESTLQDSIHCQINQYIEVMAAPNVAQSLLTQFISELSNSKGSISLQQWKEKMRQIGTDLAAIDGYYKEYQKSLVRLCDLTSSLDTDSLYTEFTQGVSVQPAHMRNNFDFPREYWELEISKSVSQNMATIVKGVSGQGKSTLCYRYLMNHYPEELVFCVRSITSERQAENLVAALSGITKHTPNTIIYIDVNPGEYQWIYLLQELQSRGVFVPVLISIRDEDFNMTPIKNKTIRTEVVEIELTAHEAQHLYSQYTAQLPHPQFRSFEEAWTAFHESGPLIEFIYILTHNQTLSQRLQTQIDNLLHERVPDAWLELLLIVCYAGRIGCSVKTSTLKQEINCDTFSSAKKRLSDEYLIKSTEDDEHIEALHPQRANLILKILEQYLDKSNLHSLVTTLRCTHGQYAQILVMDYFTRNPYCQETIETLSTEKFKDWHSLSGLLRTMLWLDVKRYVDQNNNLINDLINQNGTGWLLFLPIDISGLIQPNKLIIENLIETSPEVFTPIKREELMETIVSVRQRLSSLQIDYQATDCFISLCEIPTANPSNDTEWSAFGYSLFWFAMRQRKIDVLPYFNLLNIAFKSGDSLLMANAMRGLWEHCESPALYDDAVSTLMEKIKQEYCIVYFRESEIEVQCKFVPPVFANESRETETKNFNHYWKIKLLDILQQLYSDKDFIDIEVVGTDLLSELGIKAMDKKVRIAKKNRHLEWVTDINSWEKSRIDYLHRPENWNEYVSTVDQLRQRTNSFVVNLISCLDDFYKKQRFNQMRWNKVIADIELYKNSSFLNLLLPKSTVDRYCLYREDMQDSETSNTELSTVSHQSLSYAKYVEFRKSLNATQIGIENFMDQFSYVLSARKDLQNVDKLVQLRLSRYNLFDSSKKLLLFQQEYEKLFRRYSNLGSNFSSVELENRMILLNMWTYICESPPRGYAIAYDAKQRHRKTHNTIQELIKTIPSCVNVDLLEMNQTVYLVRKYDLSRDVPLEDDYKEVMSTLRNHFKTVTPLMSERWYIETHDPTLTYLPTVNGIPLTAGFMIPLYRLLDDNGISTSLLPVEIPDEVEKILLRRNQLLRDWKNAYVNLAAMRMMMLQYNNVVSNLDGSNICKIGLRQYIALFYEGFSKLIEGFSTSFSVILKTLNSNVSEATQELVEVIASFQNGLSEINSIISNFAHIDDCFIELSNNIFVAMILLQSDFMENDN